MIKKTECNCKKCISCCENKPGWMKFSDLRKIANYLDMSEKQLFDKYLGVDYWIGDEDEDDILVLSPAIKGKEGEFFPYDPRGKCTFLKRNKCIIHPVKPFECALTIHSMSQDDCKEIRWKIIESWKKHQMKIKKLYGDYIKIPQPTGMFGMFGLW